MSKKNLTCLRCGSSEQKVTDTKHICTNCGYERFIPNEEYRKFIKAQPPSERYLLPEETRSLTVLKRFFPDRFEYNDPNTYDKLPANDKRRAQEWIGTDVRPSKKVHPMDSPGLKHIVQKSIGLYLTNGEFNGAMRAAGYRPIDADSTRWEFKIRVYLPKGMFGGCNDGWYPVDPKELRASGFISWLLRQKKRDDRVGDLARDLEYEVINMPSGEGSWFSVKPRTRRAYREFLEERHACDGALESFEQAFDEYQHQ